MADQPTTVPERVPRILPCVAWRFAALVTIAVTMVVGGCARDLPRPAEPDPAGPLSLELLSVAILPSRPVGPDTDRATHFGSVSGITWDEHNGRYLGIIDDHQPARFAWLDVQYVDGRLSVTVDRVVPLVPGAGVERRRVVGADLEAVAALGDGTFIASEEGHVGGPTSEHPGETWPVAFLHFDRGAVVRQVMDWPSAFAIDAQGIRANQGAEALAVTPDGRLVAGLEQPRVADAPVLVAGTESSPDPSALLTRLVEFVKEGRTWRAARQWAYQLAPTRLGNGFDAVCGDGENGLTELLALDASTFLSLERACLVDRAGRARNRIAIYRVSLDGADDVSTLVSLQDVQVRGVAKELVLDFESIVSRLPPELDYLDNFEGMTFGPVLADGSRTLLVVSDDNFRATQKTVFLLLRLSGLSP